MTDDLTGDDQEIPNWLTKITFLRLRGNTHTHTHTHTQLIYDKGAKNIQGKKESLFSKCCWENQIAICKRLKLDPNLTSYKKINSKWIKTLNVNGKPLNSLKKTGSTQYIGTPLVGQWLALCIHCRGFGFNSWLGNQNPTSCMAKKTKDPRKQAVHFLTSVLAIFFWICLLRQEKQK